MLRPLCQVAMLSGQTAELTWQDHGQWSLLCLPVVSCGEGRLQVSISLWPDGAAGQAVVLTSEPGITTDSVFRVASARIGRADFSIWAQVRRLQIEKLVREKML